MILSFYNNSQDPRVIDKTPVLISENIPFQLTDRVSITDPVLLVDYSAGYMSANYVFIPEFGRYYYITDKSILNGNQLQLTLHVDVLTSHKSSILNTQVIAKRSSSKVNAYMPDNLCPPKGTIQTYYRRAAATPFGYGSNNYVLVIGGK